MTTKTPAIPWTVDEDNDQRIVVKDAEGHIVHSAEWADIPSERGAAFAEEIVMFERGNAHAMVAAVNTVYGGGGK